MKLAILVEQYVAHRQSLGEKCRTNRNVLRAFCRSVGAGVLVEKVCLQKTTRFLYGNGPVTSAWHVRHSALKGFFRYAVGRGYISTMPLPAVVPQRPPPFVSYLYSREEVRRLLDAAGSYQRLPSCTEPVTMRVLILLLYATGLRIHEALALNLSNVDLDECLLTVLRSKFYKTRLVPFSRQLGPVLREYLSRPTTCGAQSSAETPLFTTRVGRRLNQGTVGGAFRRLREQAGIRRSDGARYQPRLHDLRHAFAVSRVVRWYQQGKDVQRLLHHLSVYLGHVRLAHTQVYLSMTPELLQRANRRFQRYAKRLPYE